MCLVDIALAENGECPLCRARIPALYIRDYATYPPMVLNAVGFRQHGKTVYFASLFRRLRDMSVIWPGFYTLPISDASIDTVMANLQSLETGQLPAASQKSFPVPTLVRMANVPEISPCSLLFYDTAGECFERTSDLVEYAGFLQRARTVLFIISPADLVQPAEAMYRLLATYISGLSELNGDTHRQHLVVAFSKADLLASQLTNDSADILGYLTSETPNDYRDMKTYLQRMRSMSTRLAWWCERYLGARQFVNAARDHFDTVHFSVFSALGARPQGSRLTQKPVCRRVMDPLLFFLT